MFVFLFTVFFLAFVFLCLFTFCMLGCLLFFVFVYLFVYCFLLCMFVCLLLLSYYLFIVFVLCLFFVKNSIMKVSYLAHYTSSLLKSYDALC